MSAQRQATLLRVVLALAAVTTVLTMSIALLGLPALFSSANNSVAVRAGTDLQGCRSDYASRVTEAQNVDAAAAAARVQTADSVRVDYIAQLLQASVAEDEAGAADALRRLVTAQAEAAAARAELAEARKLVVDRTAAYRAAIKRSLDDPTGFLATCRDRHR